MLFSFCLWVSYMHIRISSLLSLSPTHSHPTLLGHHRAELSSLCYTAASHKLSALYKVVIICQCDFVSSSYPLLPPPATPVPQVHRSPILICVVMGLQGT